MRKSKQTIARLLVAFADALDSMDDREFDLLIQGKAKLRLVEEQPEPKKQSVEDTCLDQTVAEIAQKTQGRRFT